MGVARTSRVLVVITAAGLTAWPATASTPAAAGPAEPEQLPGLVRPVPLPLVEPRGPDPVPLPLVEPREPGPVPMPQLDGGLLVDVEELTPLRSRRPEPVSRRRR
jgi:hypothetical protein